MNKILWLIFLYILLIFRHGYEYGRNDQVEVLPYAFKIAGIYDFKSDFFTETISQVIPNERIVVAGFLSLFGSQQEIMVFLLHIFINLGLIVGLLRIAEHFLKHFYLSIIAILLLQIVFFYWNLGGNELYGNNLQGSSFAEVLSVWAIVFFLQKKYIPTFLFISIGIGFQAIAALQVGLLMAGVLCFEQIKNLLAGKFSIPKEIVIALSIFVIFGLGYVFWVKKASEGNPISSTEAQAIFDITFRFRNPHHYIPTAFSLKGWLLMPICAIASLYFFRKDNQMLLVLTMAGILLVIYTIGVEIFENGTIASFQAYKMTIWLKFLGMIAILGIIKEKIPARFSHYFTFHLKQAKENALLIGTIAILLSIIFYFPAHLPYPIHFDFKSYSKRGEEVSLCQKIEANTAQNAVFIAPFSFTELPIYAKRGNYISYKANMRHVPHIFEWANRLNMLYGLDYQAKKWDVLAAPAHYENLSMATLAILKEKGITHAIFNTEKPYLQQIAKTEHYFVYKL